MIRAATGLPQHRVAWNPSHPGSRHTEVVPYRFTIRRYSEMGNRTGGTAVLSRLRSTGLSIGNELQAAYARPANSRVSVLTLMDSPSLTKNGTWISIPVSSFADLVTAPLAVLPRAPGSVFCPLS